VAEDVESFANPASLLLELKGYLSQSLPDYMIPGHFMQLDKLPLTPNGKIDQKALPEPEVSLEKYEAPRNASEEKMVEIWSEVLKIEKEKISINANFFQLGGHSLKATSMVLKINKEFNAAISLIELFKTPTIKSLSGTISLAERRNFITKDDDLVLLKTGVNNDGHLFLLHDGSGDVEGYVEFCKGLTNQFNYWGLRIYSERLENLPPRNCTIEELAQKYIEKIKKIQPQWPYYIAGWSLGGTIAFEMALQLENIGEKVSFLGLIDAPGPQKDRKAKANKFTLKAEKKWIREYLPNQTIKKKIKNTSTINDLWTKVMEYLAENNFSANLVRQVIPDQLAQIIPNYDRLGIRELVSYLNINRTLANARDFYIPSKKIHTTLHYFRASKSPGILQDCWDDYCLKPIKSFEIPGDHISILKKPQVDQTIEIFDKILYEMNFTEEIIK
jgi:fengycin family lipopeptide synthetase D/gramicidin S synthase 2/tyrocidine synthetase-3